MGENNTFGIQMGQAAAGTAQTIGGAAMGLLLGGINDKRQLKQQQKLQNMAIQGNKELSAYNYEQQMKMWEATNYAAQMGQLQKAGLNPGLIYGMSGGGGATTNAAQAQGVGTGHAPQGGGEAMEIMQMGIQSRLLQAQEENIRAQTQNIQADTANKPKTGENIEATTASIKQGIQNAKAIEILTKVETEIAKLQQEFQDGTLEQRIANIATEGSKLMAQTSSAMAQANVDRSTQETNIKQAQQNLLNSITQNAAIKQAINESAARVHKTDQEIQTIIKTRFQSGEYLSLAMTGQNTEQNKIRLDNMYRSIAQETGMAEDIIKMIGGAMMGAGIKGMPNAPRTEDTYGEMDGRYYETHKKSY